MLSDRERNRYERQLIFPDWGETRQELLKGASVFIAGVGGLGSPVALYLAAAGVGTLRLCDSGQLEQSNLNRQILYETGEIGRPKADIAKARIHRVNPDIDAVALTRTIRDDVVAELVGEADLIVDCLDNYIARYVLNRFSVLRGIPMIHAGISGWVGQLTFLSPPETPCLECLFPDAPVLNHVPVIGTTPGVIGTMEAAEAIKYLSGKGPSLKGRLLIWEGDTMDVDKVIVERDPGCSVCGSTPV